MRVRLADLGCSVRLESKTAKRTYGIGTPGYIPPEALETRSYGLPFDIWSLGALMYALFSFTIPFFDEDDESRERRVCNEPLSLETKREFDYASDEAKDLINGMLEKNPDKRLTIE